MQSCESVRIILPRIKKLLRNFENSEGHFFKKLLDVGRPTSTRNFSNFSVF